jgi:hypothetical protein
MANQPSEVPVPPIEQPPLSLSWFLLWQTPDRQTRPSPQSESSLHAVGGGVTGVASAAHTSPSHPAGPQRLLAPGEQSPPPLQVETVLAKPALQLGGAHVVVALGYVQAEELPPLHKP